jgi:hypothetical protein
VTGGKAEGNRGKLYQKNPAGRSYALANSRCDIPDHLGWYCLRCPNENGCLHDFEVDTNWRRKKVNE